MPSLQQLTCHIELAGSDIPLQEYGTTYSNGLVEAYIAVPPVSGAFTVHLTSTGYISSGLAMFVFMDGVYQCNRNRQGLKLPSMATRRSDTEVDFRLRQKEEKLLDGGWLGKEWRFEKLKVGR